MVHFLWIRNIPQGIPRPFRKQMVSSRSSGGGTPGSKIALVLLSTVEKLKLTMALFLSFIS